MEMILGALIIAWGVYMLIYLAPRIYMLLRHGPPQPSYFNDGGGRDAND
jgi:hypothetical protein